MALKAVKTDKTVLSEVSPLNEVPPFKKGARGISQSEAPIVAEVVETQNTDHPGQVLVKWTQDDTCYEQWLQCVNGAICAPGAEVLLQHPQNRAEPIVTSVLGTDTPNTEPAIRLADGETIKVLSKEGVAVMELTMTDTGPVVKLLSEDTNIDLENKLRIDAQSIELNAREGNVQLTSDEDVVVVGRYIYLN